MIKNYVLIAVRSLKKNPVFTFINIFGLALGMASFLFIVHYVRYEHSYEDFHTKADNIHRITLASITVRSISLPTARHMRRSDRC